MTTFSVVEVVHIDVAADLARRQFADVHHHAANQVHRGVVFEVIDDDEQRCRYRQTSSLGPFRIRQVFELTRTESGPLVNRIVDGQFVGGSITFDVRPLGPTSSEVHATLAAPLTGPMKLLEPLLRRKVGRQLAAGLTEDKMDLEGGHYPRIGTER